MGNFLFCMFVITICSIFMGISFSSVEKNIKRGWYFLSGLGIGCMVMYGTFIAVWTLRMIEVI